MLRNWAHHRRTPKSSPFLLRLSALIPSPRQVVLPFSLWTTTPVWFFFFKSEIKACASCQRICRSSKRRIWQKKPARLPWDHDQPPNKCGVSAAIACYQSRHLWLVCFLQTGCVCVGDPRVRCHCWKAALQSDLVRNIYYFAQLKYISTKINAFRYWRHLGETNEQPEPAHQEWVTAKTLGLRNSKGAPKSPVRSSFFITAASFSCFYTSVM